MYEVSFVNQGSGFSLENSVIFFQKPGYLFIGSSITICIFKRIGQLTSMLSFHSQIEYFYHNENILNLPSIAVVSIFSI